MSLRALVGVLMASSLGVGLSLALDGVGIDWQRFWLSVAVSLGLVVWGSLWP